MITNEVIRNFLNCHYKSFLKFHNKSGEKTEFELLEQELLSKSRIKLNNRLKIKLKDSQILQDIQNKNNHQILEPTYAIQPFFQENEFMIYFDIVEILSNKESSDKFSYVPMEIIAKESVSKTDKISFVIKCLVFSQIQKYMPEFGKLIYGSDLKITKIHVLSHINEASRLLKKLIKIVSCKEPPRFFHNSHCKICEFQTACKKELVEKDDLSLLGTISQKEVLKQNSKGIFTTFQFSHSFRPRKSKKKVKNLKNKKCEWALKALALREKRTYIQAIPRFPKKTEIYLDFEGLPDENFIYLIGLLIKKDNTENKLSFWADSKKEEKIIFQKLLNTISNYNDVAIYHYGSYEIRALKKINRLFDNQYNDNLTWIVQHSRNILSLFTSSVYPPTYTNGLKDIANFLGFKWSEENPSGIQSIVWRKKWELYHNDEYKQKLIQYNLDDLQALALIKYWLASIEGKVAQGESEQFTKVDDIKINRTYAYHFGDTDYILADFEKVNRYSYFDYQRNKVYLKTSTQVKKAVSKVRKIKKTVNKIDKLIQIWPKECPDCHNNKISKTQYSKRIVVDLKFMMNGLKKWVLEERGGRFQCRQCGHLFIPKEYQRSRRFKYGHNLMVWAINEHITYRTSPPKISQKLLELFNIKASPTAIYGFKSIIAEKYAETVKEIKQRVIGGYLLHADETKVIVKGNPSGYVWVFANMDSVFYLFRPTREADFLKALLNDFQGVLVSDFYSGYDSLPCPQQKCLVHLIRDLNEDLLNHQFDAEFKAIVKNFGKLLRKIMETINRYGLKKRNLNKHHKDVDHFYDHVLNQDYESEISLAYQKRLNKYKEKLFTFLNYDGIPWNNNNAEHAIKPFAIYRDSVSAILAEGALKDYLVLLSIQQTCRYRGISFLEFLKSGERSIDKYSKY